ncbi:MULTISPECIES: GNAT family N-acetyltransferase [unclassified Mesotoga]|jgi:RimJ/RimL family protein N-acetyltransferase|uniref:GNAT family N-acetyltransferase n=1 Tax=unclassified Mesotoga TaxID=1184398 RepID=UPI000EF1BB57|nr:MULTISPECIES: GNAT family N-acetyltransferase [unclassified Mesotoga]MDI9368771.1 GNAT family N-acetyltransferase [Thermotogota bacterium]NLT46694.1 GNAT family N-acetyltransferase [Thermotogaceae bacterium]MDD4206528.1 GNAT family N-acetyltransferase [Mesotoga sp.]MDD4825953.1 GNAT family N-acetyltransferase [Mesotoga sp.]MDD5683241.1 GNAT family N-acetyltransferase [Mesotoga sp.]
MIKRLEKVDHLRVMEIVETIWEGDDYIPQVFEKWVRDPSCYFMGLWKGGKLIGIDNLRLFSRQVGWMEGMRIDPAFQGRGYGKELGKEMLQLTRNLGIERLYFATYFDNTASIKMNEAFGFERIAVFTNLEKEIDELTSHSVDLVECSEIPQISCHISEDWSFIPKEVPNKTSFLIHPVQLSDGANWAVLSMNSKFNDCLDINFIEMVDRESIEVFVKELVFYAKAKGFGRMHTMASEDFNLEPFLLNGFKPFERTKDVFLYYADGSTLQI